MTSPAQRTRRKDARPAELLEAALNLFVENGYAGTRVEEVAKQAGVSKGTLFHYFASKEELFKAVVRQNIAEQIGNWNNEFDEFTGDTPHMVRYALRQWWQRIGATKLSGISRLVMMECKHFPEIATFYRKEVIEPSDALLRRILQRGIDRGEFQSVDPTYGIYGLLAPMRLLIMWKHDMTLCTDEGLPIDPEAFIESQVEMLLNGLLTRP